MKLPSAYLLEKRLHENVITLLLLLMSTAVYSGGRDSTDYAAWADSFSQEREARVERSRASGDTSMLGSSAGMAGVAPGMTPTLPPPTTAVPGSAEGQGLLFSTPQQQPGTSSPGGIITDGQTTNAGVDQLGVTMPNAGPPAINNPLTPPLGTLTPPPPVAAPTPPPSGGTYNGLKTAEPSR